MADTFYMGVSSSSCLHSKHFTMQSYHPDPSQYKINIKTLPAYSRVLCSTEPHYFSLTRWCRTSLFEHGPDRTERHCWMVVCRQECTGVTIHSRMLDRLMARYLQHIFCWDVTWLFLQQKGKLVSLLLYTLADLVIWLVHRMWQKWSSSDSTHRKPFKTEQRGVLDLTYNLIVAIARTEFPILNIFYVQRKHWA